MRISLWYVYIGRGVGQFAWLERVRMETNGAEFEYYVAWVSVVVSRVWLEPNARSCVADRRDGHRILCARPETTTGCCVARQDLLTCVVCQRARRASASL